jgi:hypothetical protein
MATAAIRRRRLTLAPLPRSASTLGSASSETASSGSRFACLGSDSSGSDSERDGIPFLVAEQAIDEEVRDEGSSPVIHRRRKTSVETVNDFWREIGFPTLLSRFWEKDRRSSSPPGKSSLFCRSVDVYAKSDGAED